MTKNELARELAVSEHLHLSTAVQAVDGIIRIVKEALVDGDEITLRGFGTIATVDVKARNAHNFQTGEPIYMPAYRTAKIRASKELIEALNDKNNA